MILVCGATGELGGRIARLLVGEGRRVRALVRPTTDASGLQADGIEVIRGDLRDPPSLAAAMAGVDTVVTTANAIGRLLAGAKDLTIAAVDGEGNKHLIRAAARAGVGRFVLVSAAGLNEDLARLSPLMAAKWAAERELRSTSMQIVLVRPDMFQEVWLAPATGIDPAAGTALIYGRGEIPHRYVAIDDVARLCAHLAVVADPPRWWSSAGPRSCPACRWSQPSRLRRAEALKVRHVPDAAMSIGHWALARMKPEVASLMGMALFFDTHPGTWDDGPLREAGIEPRPASAFIKAATLGTGLTSPLRRCRGRTGDRPGRGRPGRWCPAGARPWSRPSRGRRPRHRPARRP